jgi:hypothetical protein
MQKDKPKVQFGLIGLDFAPLFFVYFIYTMMVAYQTNNEITCLYLALAAIPFAIKVYQ